MMQKICFQIKMIHTFRLFFELSSNMLNFLMSSLFLHQKSLTYANKSSHAVLFRKPNQAAFEWQVSKLWTCFKPALVLENGMVYPIQLDEVAYRIQNQDRISIFASPKLF